MSGKLYLIPTHISGDPKDQLPPGTIKKIQTITYFIAERAKTARRFLKEVDHPEPMSEITVFEIPKKQKYQFLEEDLGHLKKGHNMGLLSEAGSPGVADPGAEIVKKAYEMGIEVVPLSGPSSLILALMASGLNGQRFSFHGYLSPKKEEVGRDLKKLERFAEKDRGCHFFIETPYRNLQVFDAALQNLKPTTLLSVQCDLLSSESFSKTQSVEGWKKSKRPDLHKRPAVFLIQSA
jgi:16S rRNA (cytidine1402-2'-O)-methyltransferase